MDVKKNMDNGNYQVALSDKFTFMDHAAFRDVLEDINTPDIQKIIFDLSGLIFIDSSGLGQLLLAHDTAAACEKPLIIKGASGQVKKMFSIAQFDSMFTLQE